MVQKVGTMTPAQVEMELHREAPGVRAVGAAEREPASGKSSAGSPRGRVTVPEAEAVGQGEATAGRRLGPGEAEHPGTGDADHEQEGLFLPPKASLATPKSGTLRAGQGTRLPGLARGPGSDGRLPSGADDARAPRRGAAGLGTVASAEASLSGSRDDREEPSDAEGGQVNSASTLKRTGGVQRLDAAGRPKRRKAPSSAATPTPEPSRAAASEGTREAAEVDEEEARAPDSAVRVRAGARLADADSELYYCDLLAENDGGRTRAQRMAAGFVQNMKLLAYLTYRIDHLRQSEKFKRRVNLQQQVRRLAMIRKDTSYNIAVMAFMKRQGASAGRGPPTVETEEEMKRAFKQAMSKRVESEAYRRRLRAPQVDELLAYKGQVQRGRIADFKPAFDLLSKIPWFGKYDFGVREKLVNRAVIKVYEPGALIIAQNAESPDINVILRGSVEVAVTRRVWGHPVTFTLGTFFDGQLFGEMADFESCKDQLTYTMLRQLQSQKYSCRAQEQCCVLHINKKELAQLSAFDVAEDFQQRLDFIKAIDIFKNVSLFSLLPITNNLVRKTYKLGEVILFKGEVPEGLYLVRSGVCKVGVDQITPLQEAKVECPYVVNAERGGRNFAHGSECRDPIRDSRRGAEHLEVARAFDPSSFRGERVGEGVIRKLQSHEAEVKKLTAPDKYRARKRLFAENKHVLLDDDKQPIGDNQAALREFLPFFKLAEKEHFGGRVLVAESTVTNEGKEYNADGQSFI